MKKLVQVLGPTGVGKSEAAVRLAGEIGAEIISADSMQVYRGFDIGTSKLKPEHRRDIPHHLIDVLSDCSQYNAARFLHMSHEIAEQIINRKKIPLVCGGTALYLRIQARGIFPENEKKRISRRSLEYLAQTKGLGYLWNRLNRIDPQYGGKIGPNDRIRIIRALDIYYNQGVSPSEIFKKTRTPFQDYEFIRIGLILDRRDLYETINRRVERMMSDGFVREVEELRKIFPSHCPPFQSLGYRELCLYLDGQIDLNTAVSLIQQHTRNFAKRQLSWFRQETDIHWFEPSDVNGMLGFLSGRLGDHRGV